MKLLQLTAGADADLPESPGEQSDRQRAVRLLRDSLCDAKVALSRSLTKSLDSDDTKETGSDVLGSRSLESVLEQYSEQLSARALQLFKQKLDEQRLHEQTHAAVTKL